MKTIYKSLILLLVLLVSTCHREPRSKLTDGPMTEVATAKRQLQHQIELIQWIEPYVERSDLGRLLILKAAAEKTLDTIHNRGLAHMDTLREYQVLIIRYRYSDRYLEQISSTQTKPLIVQIKQITQQIIKDRGFDDSPYTKVTYGIFDQMKKNFDDLRKMDIDSSLKQKIEALTIEFGRVLSLAQEGDRPRTFEAARTLHREVVALYPELNKVAYSSPAFNIVISIQGLAEFYHEYAQIDD